MAKTIWDEKRVNLEYNTGKDFESETFHKFSINNQILKLFQEYKKDARNKQLKQQLVQQVKEMFVALGYDKTTVTLDSKGFHCLSGHTQINTRGMGGSFATITWDCEQ